jgi:transposase-like protein
MTTKRKRYSKEFKLEAVRLLEEGKKPPVEVARELGIQRNQLYKWQEQLSRNEEAAFPGSGRRIQNKDAEIARLKKELEIAREEAEILKKAAKYFARESG